jgi:hypothetical protein
VERTPHSVQGKASRPPGGEAPSPQRTAAAERALPPVPRFDEQPAAPSLLAAAADSTLAGETGSRAAPARMPPVGPPTAGTAPAAAAGPAAGAARQQVVLREGERGRPGEEAGEEDETAPVVLSKLAQRVRSGRQSLAPSKVGAASHPCLAFPTAAASAGLLPACLATAELQGRRCATAALPCRS